MRRLKIVKIFFIFMLFIVFMVISNIDKVSSYFFATLSFNAAILTVFTVGLIIIFQSAIRLTMLVGTIGVISYKKGEELDFYLKGIGKLMPATIANMFEKRAKKGVLYFTDNEAKDVTAWLEDQFFNTKGYVGFFVATSLMIGLFGTFTGLLKAIDDMGAIILSLGGDINIAEVMSQFSGPLGGMAVGFGSSLFGVASAIILNFLQYILSRQEAIFIEDVQDWLKARLIESQSPDVLSKIGQVNEKIVGGGGVDTTQVQVGKNAFLDIFVEEIGKLSEAINTQNKTSEVIFKQLSQYLEKTDNNAHQEMELFSDISTSLKELNINQFSNTAKVEEKLEELNSIVLNFQKMIKTEIDTNKKDN